MPADEFFTELGGLLVIVDPDCEPQVILGGRIKDAVLRVQLFLGEGTVALKGRRLTWSRAFRPHPAVEGLPSGGKDYLFPWGYPFSMGDASVEVLAAITRDLIGIERTVAGRLAPEQVGSLPDRVDRNIQRLAQLGHGGGGLTDRQKEVATKRAMELMVMSVSGRSGL